MTLAPAHRGSGAPGQIYRPCWVEIDTVALRANWRALRALLKPSVDMLAVVKANAYGHGTLTCARVAVEEGASLLGVSSLEEGVLLRSSDIRATILVLGSLFPFTNFPVLFEHQLTPTIASVDSARALSRLAQRKRRKLAVHLKIDSGFGRIGVQIHRARAFIQDVAKLPGLTIEGIYTHFSSSDVDPTYTRLQSQRFQEVIQSVSRGKIKPRWIHQANSSAIIRYPETHGTLVRPGLAFYGIPPFAGAEKRMSLAPALSWKSRVIFLKMIPKGFPVSYARTWTARRLSRIATLAVGYADGYPRGLSNKSTVLLSARRVPVIGRVTMDMIMVDVTDVPSVAIGDEAVLLGRQGKESLTAWDLARSAKTNAYEILARIADRVPRLTR